MLPWAAALVVGALGLVVIGLGQWWSLSRPVHPRVGRWFHGRRWPAVLTDRQRRSGAMLQAMGSCFGGLAFALLGGSYIFDRPSAWLLFAVVSPLQWLGVACLIAGYRKAARR